MKTCYQINNPQVVAILDDIKDQALNDRNILEKINSLPKLDNHIDYTSKEYLIENCLPKINNLQFAEVEQLVNISNLDTALTNKFKVLNHYLQSVKLTIAALYPPHGLLSWHHNGDSSGYDVLFTYSMDGNGYFRYYDYLTDDIITVPDVKGWSFKINYFSDAFLTDKVNWHCVKTNSFRLSIGFQITRDDVERIKTLLGVH